jgi:hypothetical protein
MANIANYSVTSQCVVVKVQIRVYLCTAGCYHSVCSRRLSLVVLTNAKLFQRSHWPFKRSQVSHVFNKSPFPPFHVAEDLGVCCFHSNNCMGNDTTASRRQPNIIIVHETSESGVNIPASIPADIGGTKKAHVFRPSQSWFRYTAY